MKRAWRTAIRLAVLTACAVALGGCPDGDDGWSLVIHGDANPGDGNGGFSWSFNWGD